MNKNIFVLFLLGGVCVTMLASTSAMAATTPPLNLNKYSKECKIAALKAMGWQIESTPTTALPHAGNNRQCWYQSGQVVTAPKMQLPDPSKATADQPNNQFANVNVVPFLDTALRGSDSQCLFQHQFNKAIETSATAFNNKFLYGFSNIIGDVTIGDGDAKLQRVAGWQGKTCENSDGNGNSNQCFVPDADDHIHEALINLQNGISPLVPYKKIYLFNSQSGILQSDCTTGLELLEYSAVDGLFGAQQVQKQFTAEDFYVGTNWGQSNSILGQNVHLIQDYEGKDRARKGPEAMIGAPGIILKAKVMTDNLSDDTQDRIYSFTVAKISPQAQFTPGNNDLIAQIWHTAGQLSNGQLTILEQLLEAEQPLQFIAASPILGRPSIVSAGRIHTMSEEHETDLQHLVQFLNDPFIAQSEFLIVPFGTRSLAWHLIHQARMYSPKHFDISLQISTLRPGAVGDLNLAGKGMDVLDDYHNQGENFVITKMSQKATAALLAKNGIWKYDDLLKQIWLTAKDLDRFELEELDELLKSAGPIRYVDNPMSKGGSYIETADAVRSYISSSHAAIYQKLVPLMNDPLLYDTEIYVHPVGFHSILWHLIRLVRLNPRTPFSIQFYSDTIHGEIFDRWVKMKLETCGQ